MENRQSKIKNEILFNLAQNIRGILSATDFEGVEELRLRAELPLMVYTQNKAYFINERGEKKETDTGAYKVTKEDILKTLELVCDSSVYAVQSDIRQGFVTIAGGHRVGIAGKAVLSEGEISYIKDVSGLNFRIAREIKGAANKVIQFVAGPEGIKNTLIISPPKCGKTTMIRDLARQLSSFHKVGIVDERSEIAACYKGVSQFDLGRQTDILDACPKSKGMIIMLRAMSPDVIITDEIGLYEDIEAIKQVSNAGIKVITTVHGFGRSDIYSKEIFKDMYHMFDCIVVLNRSLHAGMIEEVYYTKRNRVVV